MGANCRKAGNKNFYRYLPLVGVRPKSCEAAPKLEMGVGFGRIYSDLVVCHREKSFRNLEKALDGASSGRGRAKSDRQSGGQSARPAFTAFRRGTAPLAPHNH